MNSSNTMEKGRRSRFSSMLKLGALVAAAALVLAGCGDGDGGSGETTGSDGSGGSKVCAIGGADAFFSVVKNGADAAGQHVTDAGGEYVWIVLEDYDNIGPDMVKLIEQAVSMDCTSISLPVWDADAQDPAIAKAREAGINIFIYNSGGEEEVVANDALGYFGTDELQAGIEMGNYMADNGVKNVRCVNTSPGAVNHEARCKGAIQGVTENGGQGDQLILPAENFGDAAAVSAAVKETLAADPSIDGLTAGCASDADAIATALETSGLTDKVKLGSFDISENIANRIIDGTQLLAVDQQGWYQGWLAVSAAWQYDDYAILPASPIILTGPAPITAENAEVVKAGILSGHR